MATSKVIFWCGDSVRCFAIFIWSYSLINLKQTTDGSKQEGVPGKVKELEQLKHLSTKMQYVAPLELLTKM